MKRTSFAFVLVALWAMAPSLWAQGTLVFNGTFDAGTSGWAMANVYGDGYLSAGGNPDGFLALLGPASPAQASQLINGLTAGADYLVSANYVRASGKKNLAAVSLEVAINGTAFFQTATPPDLDWRNLSFVYHATGSSALLSISSQLNGSDTAYLIDNISMMEVPEAGSGWLFVGGGVALFLCGRRGRGFAHRCLLR